jgi:translation initiation factor 1 (eIF-1/SUI1)
MLSPTQINKENEVPKDVLLKAVGTHVKECYSVLMLDEEELVKSRMKVHKGSMPHVLVKAMKVSNKNVTTISGLELFQIDYEELVPFLAHKCAGSTTLHEGELGSKKDTFVV